MKCYFRSFDVGPGDCNVIRLVKDSGEQFVIMVDCGNYTTDVKKYVKNTLHNRIDLLIATHIDGDHIQGLTQMLQKHRGLTIGKIWYNAYRRTNKKSKVTLTEQQKRIIEQIKESYPVEFDAINYREVSAKQGKTLAEVILKNENYNRVWKKEAITNTSKDFAIPGGWGKIVFFGPQPAALKEIEKRFKEKFDTYFMQKWNDSIERGEELQELLIRLADGYQNIFEPKPVSASYALEYDAAFVRKQANTENEDHSKTNYSSIAFMLEVGEHKIAMLADAYADTIVAAIDAKYSGLPKPIECDAIKVPHHGSDGNNSWLLYSRINSHRYFIPGGRSDEYPTWGTLGRIADSNKDGQEKQVVFSFESDNAQKMYGMKEKEKGNLCIKTIISQDEYELFE